MKEVEAIVEEAIRTKDESGVIKLNSAEEKRYAIEYLYKKGGYLLWDYGNTKDYSIEYKKG